MKVFLVESLSLVDKYSLSKEKDRTEVESIKMIINQFVIANGVNKINVTFPKKPICKELGIELINGLGGKIQSPSL